MSKQKNTPEQTAEQVASDVAVVNGDAKPKRKYTHPSKKESVVKQFGASTVEGKQAYEVIVAFKKNLAASLLTPEAESMKIGDLRAKALADAVKDAVKSATQAITDAALMYADEHGITVNF